MKLHARAGDSKPPAPTPPVRMTLWLAMLSSVILYAVVVVVVTPSMEPISLPAAVFPVAAILAGFAGFVAHRRMTEESRRDSAPLHPMELLAWVLDEAVGVIGLVAAILAASPVTFVAYGVVSLVLLLLHRPQS